MYSTLWATRRCRSNHAYEVYASGIWYQRLARETWQHVTSSRGCGKAQVIYEERLPMILHSTRGSSWIHHTPLHFAPFSPRYKMLCSIHRAPLLCESPPPSTWCIPLPPLPPPVHGRERVTTIQLWIRPRRHRRRRRSSHFAAPPCIISFDRRRHRRWGTRRRQSTATPRPRPYPPPRRLSATPSASSS